MVSNDSELEAKFSKINNLTYSISLHKNSKNLLQYNKFFLKLQGE